MAYMRSTIAFGLIWINLIINGLIIYFFTQISSNDYSRYHSYNLRGTKEKLSKISYNEQLPKDLRNLKADGPEQLILYLDLAAMLFVILLMISFCLKKNECCTNDPEVNQGFAVGSCYGTCICCDDCCRHGNCDCNCQSSGGGDGDAALGLLIFLICIIVFIALFFAIKACGKHISRIFSARDKDELREVLTKDTLGYLSWLVLGDFVNRITASKFDNDNCKVVNYKKGTENSGYFKKIFYANLKTRDEILIKTLADQGISTTKEQDGKVISKTFKEMLNDLNGIKDEAVKKATKKRLRVLNRAQLSGYLFSGLVLGLGIPNLNIYITNKLDAKRKAEAALKQQA